VSRYRFVSTMKAERLAVSAACEAAEVSSSAYYDWCTTVAAGPPAAEWDEALVVNEMYAVHAHHDDTYGSHRMTTELRRRGFSLKHKRIGRLMAENGIVAQDGRRRRVRTTIPDLSTSPLPDHVGRDFSVGEPVRRTCGDRPTSERARDGSFSPRYSVSAHAGSLGGRWARPCPGSCAGTRSTWPSRRAALCVNLW